MNPTDSTPPVVEVPFGRRTRRKSRPPSDNSQVVAAKEAAERLNASPVFAHVSRARLARLAQGAVVRRLRAGDIIWSAEKPADTVTLIQSGLVRLGRTNSEGESFSYGIFGPGEIIGLFAYMDRGVYPTDATAVSSRVEVIEIPAGSLTEAMEREAAVGVAINRALLQFTGVLRAKIDVTSAGAVPKRLAALILYLVGRFGQMRDERVALLPLPLTREQLGELIGARFETVIRTLSDWVKAGWFRTTSEGFEVLRVDMLRQLLKS